MPRRKFWGWGYEGSGLDADELRGLAALLEAQLGVPAGDPVEPPQVEELELRPPRIAAPAALERLCTDDPHERAGHAYGKSYRDLVRALRREFPEPPDLVALPESEQDVAAILDWCTGERDRGRPLRRRLLGGRRRRAGRRRRLRRLRQPRPAAPRPRAPRRRALARGGGRGGSARPLARGAAAAARPHVPPLPAVVRVLDARRLDRHALRRPLRHGSDSRRRAGRSADGRDSGRDARDAAATRRGRRTCAGTALLRLGGRARRHHPRLGPAAGARGVSRRRVRALRALRGCGRGDAGGRALQPPSGELPPARSRRGRPLRQRRRHERDPRPRLRGSRPAGRRGARACRGALPRPRRHGSRRNRGGGLAVGVPQAAVRLRRRSCAWACSPAASRPRSPGTGSRSSTPPPRPRSRRRAGRRAAACSSPAGSRTSIPTGRRRTTPSSRPRRAGAELEQWDAIKSAVSRAILDHGGTITHHHAVGRDHRRWYDEERPELFAGALRAAKHVLDPAGSSTRACCSSASRARGGRARPRGPCRVRSASG